jgi:hypothetical protein
MGALPWTLRTSGNNSKASDDGPKVITSESSPLPKSAKVVNDIVEQGKLRRGSLDDIHKSMNTSSVSALPIPVSTEEPATSNVAVVQTEQEQEKEPLTTTNINDTTTATTTDNNNASTTTTTD